MLSNVTANTRDYAEKLHKIKRKTVPTVSFIGTAILMPAE